MRKLLLQMILNLGKKHALSLSCVLVGALPEEKNHFRKQFSHKVLYNYHSQFFRGPFSQYFKKVKKKYVFSKKDWSKVGGYPSAKT